MEPHLIVRDGYDKVSEAYRSASFDYESSGYKRFLSWLMPKVPQASRVLDLGCGCGIPVARELADRFNVTGVDISPVQIKRAQELVPRAHFICADMTAVELLSARFVAIVALYSIIHVPVSDQPTFINRCCGWLAPGGLLLISVGDVPGTYTEDDWLGVPGASMYWSNADAATYRRWLIAQGGRVAREEAFADGLGQRHRVFLVQNLGKAV